MADRRELLAHARRLAAKGVPGAAEALAALDPGIEPSIDAMQRARRATYSQPIGAEGHLSTTSLELVLPWSCLVSDNDKDFAAAAGKKMLTTEYRAAKKKAIQLVKEQMAGRPPIDRAAAFIARVIEPDRSRIRDIGNWTKIAQDALEGGGAITNDGLFDRITWLRAGVDVDRPRVEFTLHTL